MALTVTEIVENGIPYRITKDEESGLYLKESIQEPPAPEPPGPSRIDLLEDENAFLVMELATTQGQLNQVEQEQADLLLTLVSQGVI